MSCNPIYGNKKFLGAHSVATFIPSQSFKCDYCESDRMYAVWYECGNTFRFDYYCEKCVDSDEAIPVCGAHASLDERREVLSQKVDTSQQRNGNKRCCIL